MLITGLKPRVNERPNCTSARSWLTCRILSTSRMIRCEGFNHTGANQMSDRKYRQRGYMESDREPQRPKPQSKPQSKPQDREGPRSPKMMAYGKTSKCAACGEKAPSNIDVDSTCSKCNADLHTCRQCTYFDPGAHFECSKPIAARI